MIISLYFSLIIGTDACYYCRIFEYENRYEREGNMHNAWELLLYIFCDNYYRNMPLPARY